MNRWQNADNLLQKYDVRRHPKDTVPSQLLAEECYQHLLAQVKPAGSADTRCAGRYRTLISAATASETCNALNMCLVITRPLAMELP